LDVKIGDKILTSGFGEKFFPNYPVGEVVGIYKNRQELTTEFRIKTATVINNKTMVGVYSKITDKKLINK
jgi:cell shape-determining protein MreC